MPTPRDVMNHITATVLAHKQKFAKIDGTIKFSIPEVGIWQFHCVDPVSVSEGDGSADCEINVRGEDLLLIASGTLNPQALFAEGRIKVSGNVALALSAGQLLFPEH